MPSTFMARSRCALPPLPPPSPPHALPARPDPPRRAADATPPAQLTKACAVGYFYGRISRDEAESALLNRGCQQGLFLLRENVDVAGNYALSICHKNGIHHYSIERQSDGMVMIPRGTSFKGPVELICYHAKFRDGLATKPVVPCERPGGVAPKAWPEVTMLELEHAVLEAAEKQNLTGAKLENALGPQRHKFVCQVARTLHTEQSWFHGSITREQADCAIAKSGHRDGKYLVRVRHQKSFALTLSHCRTTKHYKIDKHKMATGDEKWAIEDGLNFDNLMDLVAHYYSRADGLLCKLTQSCVREQWTKKERILTGSCPNPLYGGAVKMGLSEDVLEGSFDESVSFEQDQEQEDVPVLPPPLSMSAEDIEEMKRIYDWLIRTEDLLILNPEDLQLTNVVIGNGNFGSVKRGNWRHNGKLIPIACKQLKNMSASNSQAELLHEARLMAKLDHSHIVRMIGVVRTDPVMLILELVPLGPLNKYLKDRQPQFPMDFVLRLMTQVAEGMEYLASRNYIHRDLAARNVLLASEDVAKISDFGMSKALGFGNEYYKAERHGKWPVKWYAPESIYFLRFTSKSDVWSYGVTLWEATSYGTKPYRGLQGMSKILAFLESGARLEKPDACPDLIYAAMLKCWEREPVDRPTFTELVATMKRLTSTEELEAEEPEPDESEDSVGNYLN